MSASHPRIAVAGAGLIGKRHINVASRLGVGRLSAIVDPTPASREVAEQYGVPLYCTISELLEKDRPDGIVLATPNQMHAEHALEAISAGVAVLVEKPIAHSVEAGLRLCESAHASGVPVLVGHHRCRFRGSRPGKTV